MKSNRYPKFTAAAVQAAPIFLDAQATTEKACALIRKAAGEGATFIAFPEVFIAGYAYWNWIMSPLEGSAWFKRFYLAAIDVPGPEVQALQRTAEACGVTVVIGVNERSPVSMGTIYNTNLIIGPDGKLLGRHRKTVPTFAEKLTWGYGDGSSIRTYDTPVGKVGTLACGENTNTLARFALLAQGEQVHVANYIAYPFRKSYDIIEPIKIRAAAHSLEGKVFTVVSSSAMSQEILDLLGTTPERLELLSGAPNAFSGIFGPDGLLVSPPLIDEEGIVYGEIDLEKGFEPKQFHDILGHYNRFDIFELRLHQRSLSPLVIVDQAMPTEPNPISSPDLLSSASPDRAAVGERTGSAIFTLKSSS
ncbi:carbon-nitrogen hydrolase family protein [Noviherbaspirillum sedimenti]|uniref:Carbon-nitrogen hydrolase family protein n=1 Tax=Noviherbaspirillum sedimenti TaxID=2320865 RepID=A0A3A3G2V0_9BURK|nr:carbon-nitrogen hydrolase family protein [Noviherbaspirillum sedimenti]RJG02813.1 carbon-nitrogen hydrolase family protein [Noviherbaspirillum sedimenti]